jgi:hypothetical protein
VDETWSNVTAQKLSAFASKESGEVVWQDNSGEHSDRPMGESAGDRDANARQVIVPQGDGWLRSFDPLTGKLISV